MSICIYLVFDIVSLSSEEITKLRIAMEYKHYVRNIVLTHRVMLKGWPDDIPIEKNIDYCSLANIRLLACKLRSGEIHWAEVGEEELTQFKASVPEARSERRDKGSKRGPYRKRQQDKDEDDSTGSSTRNGSKGKGSRKRKQPASVSDDDDDDDDDDDANNNNNNNDDGTATGRPRLPASRKRKGRAADERSSSAHSSSSTRTRQASSAAQDLTLDAVNAESVARPLDEGAPSDSTSVARPLDAGAPPVSTSFTEPRQVACNVQEAESGSFCLTTNASDKNAWQASDLAVLPGNGLFSNEVGLHPLASSSSLILNGAPEMPAMMQFDNGSLNNFLHMPSSSDQILRLPTPPVFGSQAMEFSHPSDPNSLPYSSPPNLMFPDFMYH